MITVIVEFKLPQPMTVDQARDTFLATAPRYQGMAGLIRKYYWLLEDGAKAGGIYLWQTRADADASTPTNGRASCAASTAPTRR